MLSVYWKRGVQVSFGRFWFCFEWNAPKPFYFETYGHAPYRWRQWGRLKIKWSTVQVSEEASRG